MPKAFSLLVLGALVLAGSPGCKPKVPVINAPFSDNFQRADLGPNWLDTSHNATVQNGKLNLVRSHNHPTWLRRRLPRNVQIDIDAVSHSPDGDLKVEVFGDGHSFDPDEGRYDTTSYGFIMGGWHNSRSIIGRLGEHEQAVKAFRDRHGPVPLVTPGRTYHWTITCRNGALDWKVDGAPYLSWTDPDPLWGPGHEFFAVGDWEANVSFSNLKIRPLP